MPFAGGTGTSSDPYQISTWEHLDSIRNNLGSYFVLNNDLDSSTTGYDTYASSNANSGKGWIPIGSDSTTEFTGNFDGNGFSISDLYINRSSEQEVGLFWRTNGATLTSFALLNVDITGNNNTGGIVGINNGTINNCFVSGLVSSPVTGSNSKLGAIAGDSGGGVISQVYSIAECNGDNRVGGLLGQNGGTLELSYSAGKVVADRSDVGGLVAFEFGGSTSNSYWDTEASGQTTTDGGGTGLTTSEMQGSSASTNMSALDFTNNWETVVAGNTYNTTTSTDGYPILQSLDKETQVIAQGAVLPSAGLYVWTGSTWKKVAGV